MYVLSFLFMCCCCYGVLFFFFRRVIEHVIQNFTEKMETSNGEDEENQMQIGKLFLLYKR